MAKNKVNSIIEVQNLSVRLRGNTANKLVDNIDFSLNEKTIIALLGKSGSGKTLTALSIMGLVNHIEGLDVKGKLILSNNEIIDLGGDEMEMGKLRGGMISMIFQDPFTSFNPSKKCGVQIEEIAGLNEANSNWIKGNILKLMSKIGVDERLYNLFPYEMSGGQLQRMGIIAALITKPKLLIADEPTTNLDASSRKDVLDLLLRIKDEFGIAILYISHDLNTVRYIADDILVMKKGKILQKLTKNDFFSSEMNGDSFDLLVTENEFVTDGNTILEIKNLSKSFTVNRFLPFAKYKKHIALEDISFDVKEGDVFGIVGESGSGKTTISRLILNLMLADSGDILFEGKPIIFGKKDKSFFSDVQVVFQNPISSLNPALSIRKLLKEAVLLNVSIKESLNIEEIIGELLEMVDLSIDILNKTSAEISGGEGQRVAIARALAVNPKLLILDESISSLDKELQYKILNLLAILRVKKRLTYVFITHDLEVSQAFCNRLIILKEGRIVEQGKVNDIFSKPKHSYTKKLLMSNLNISSY